MNRPNPLKRYLCFTLSLVLFITNGVLAYAAETNFWEQRKKTVLRTANRELRSRNSQLARLPSHLSAFNPQASLKNIDIKNFRNSQVSVRSSQFLPQIISHIPSQYGSIRKITEGASDRIILHIQDVHMNHEAQVNIGKAIQHLIDHNSVNLVGLEGAFKTLDLKPYRTFPYPKAIKTVADYLLKEHRISGPVHTAFVSPQKIPKYVGIDDFEQYNAHVKSVQLSEKVRPRIKSELKAQEQKINDEKLSHFNPRLKIFDNSVQTYRDNLSEFSTYVRTLSENQTNLSHEMEIFLSALELEETLNLKQVEIERAHLLNRLAPTLSQNQSQYFRSEYIQPP